MVLSSRFPVEGLLGPGIGDSHGVDWLGPSTSASGPVGAPASSQSSQGPSYSHME